MKEKKILFNSHLLCLFDISNWFQSDLIQKKMDQ